MSYGICMRYVRRNAKTFLDQHPDQKTLSGQIQWCGDRFLNSLKQYDGLTSTRKVWMPDGRTLTVSEKDFRVWVSHNCPACASQGKNTSHLNPPYFQRVQFSYEKLQLL